jgi:hypothetical protein
MATATAQAQASPALPFQIASRVMSRLSFTVPTTALSGAAPTPFSPIQIPAVGYLAYIDLEVTLTGTGGTAPAFTADAPFNVLQSIEFKTAAGNDIIVPLTGYQAYLMDKYGCQWTDAPYSDLKLNRQYAAIAPSAHFFLPIPLQLDPSSGYGTIPALASNRSYQLVLTASAISTVLSGAPTATLGINGTAWYWSEPPAATQGGVSQATAPMGLGTLSQWQLETPPVTPGDKYIKSNNVGNVLRLIIFTLRNAASARIDANGWPNVAEIYLDNDPMFYLTNTEWEFWMSSQYGFVSSAKDTVQSLDTGVYVLPFFSMAGGLASATDSRAQYLPTLDASQLQIRLTSLGSAASTLEILTNSVIPTDSSTLYAK